MSIFKKISNVLGHESNEEKLYQQLNTEKYKNHPYETQNLGEGMAVVNECMWEWWKPRYLINHNTRCAYEFMNREQVLTTVTTEDIDWESLEGLPDYAIETAQALSFHFPSFIRRFENGVAEVSWQLNPDGRYYMDEDGYGMTDDEEIEIYGYIDQKARVVVKFRNINDLDELDEMEKQAREKVRKSAC